MNIELQAFAASIILSSPMRVVINREGETASPKQALEMGFDFEIVFVRRDGWSLGAIFELATVAEKLWPDEWVGVLIPPSREPIPYESWQRGGNQTLKVLLKIKQVGKIKKKQEQALRG